MSQIRSSGTAGRGAPHWWMQRLSALALAPLVLWLVLSLATIATLDHATVTTWIASPTNAMLLAALVLVVCFHMALGLQVIIEDYIHVLRAAAIGILAVRAGSALVAVVSIGAVLKIAMGAD